MLTLEQVSALAPDAGTLERAKKIAKPANYAGVGMDDRAIWGVAKGSSEYQTLIDLQGPAYKCSCPVKKMPCKHAMGLLLLVALQPSTATSARPVELQEWLEKRESTSKAKATRETGEVKDTAAQARRAESRQNNVEQGLGELKRFLEDTLRMGLAESAKRTQDVWDQMQKRLVDAQAKGLANHLDRMRLDMGRGPNWTERVMRSLTRLHCLVSAYQNSEQLPPALVDDLRERIGWTKSREQICQTEPLSGSWLVLNHGTTYESGLYTQTVWLLHRDSGQFALLLNFASDYNRDSLQGGFQAGSLVQGDAFFYSQHFRQRALLERPCAFQNETIGNWHWLRTYSHSSITAAITALQQQRCLHPLQEYWPLLLSNVRLVMKDEQLVLADDDGCLLMLESASQSWQLLLTLGTSRALVFVTTSDGVNMQLWAALKDDRWHALDMNWLN